MIIVFRNPEVVTGYPFFMSIMSPLRGFDNGETVHFYNHSIPPGLKTNAVLPDIQFFVDGGKAMYTEVPNPTPADILSGTLIYEKN